LAELPAVDINMTVLEFKKLFLQECWKHRNLSPDRVRLTVGDARGKPLTDPKATMHSYIESPAETLYFKDLGPQIGWKTVFYVEYAGPILMTILLLVFRKGIYGENPELTLN